MNIDPQTQTAWETEQAILELENDDARILVNRGILVRKFQRDRMWEALDYNSLEEWAASHDLNIDALKFAAQYVNVFTERFRIDEPDLLIGRTIQVGSKEEFKPIGVKKAGYITPLAERLWSQVVGDHELTDPDGDPVTFYGMRFVLGMNERPTGALLEERDQWIDDQREWAFIQARNQCLELLERAAKLSYNELKDHYTAHPIDAPGRSNGNRASVVKTFEPIFNGTTSLDALRHFGTVDNLLSYYGVDQYPDERIGISFYRIREGGAAEHEEIIAEWEENNHDHE